MAVPSRARALAAMAAVLAVAVAVRAMPAASTPNLYGFDPYVHYYYAGFVVEHGAAAPFAGFENGVEDDRAFWPGLHLLTAATSEVTGAGLLGVFKSMPPFLGALTVLLLFLLGRRLLGVGPAVIAAALYAAADHAAFQQAWLVQETMGMPLWAALLLVALAMRPWADRRAVALVALLYIATLATHHLSHAVLVASLAIASAVAPHAVARRRMLLGLAALLPATVAWWAVLGGRTGSFPDIMGHMSGLFGSWRGAVAVAAVAALAAAALVAGRRGLRPQDLAWTGLERMAARAGTGAPRLALVGLAAAALAAAGLVAASPDVPPWEGVGPSQVTKYALASLGAVGAVSLLAARDAAARPLVALALAFAAAFASVVLVLTFLPLQLRLFDFAYVPISLLAGAGAWRIAAVARPAAPGPSRTRQHAARAAALGVLAVVLVAMVAEDAARMTSSLSERYYHSDAELDAARWVRDNTEPHALVCTPFGMQPVVMALGERETDVVVARRAMEGGGWWAAEWELQKFREHAPTYVVLTTDVTKYGETEREVPTLEGVFAVGGTFLRAPSVFEFKYLNAEVLVLEVTANITGV